MLAVLAASFVICCVIAAMLQRTASRMRAQCLACLENTMLEQRREGIKTDYISSLIERVRSLRQVRSRLFSNSRW